MNNVQCKFCGKCRERAAIANAYTYLIQENNAEYYESTDDSFGVDVCQVCDIPVSISKNIRQIVTFFSQNTIASE